MIARKYNSPIGIWQSVEVSDNYGGSTVEDSLVYSVWANVKTKRASILQENGQRDNISQIIFTIRNRYDVNFSVKDNFIKLGSGNFEGPSPFPNTKIKAKLIVDSSNNLNMYAISYSLSKN